MKRFAAIAILVVFASPVFAQKGAKATPEQCRQGAEYMIQVGEQSVAKGGRPELVEKRRAQVESWKRRLAAGEDPCAVYTDIGKAATTF